MGHFHTAVAAVFKNWTALQLAVSQGAAGPQSAAIATWMVEATVQWFAENKDLECYEVEDFLSDIVHQEFNVLIEDGSVSEVSSTVCNFYRLSQSNEAELLSQLEKLPKCDLTQCKVENDAPATSTPHCDDEDMEVENNSSEPAAVTETVDPDGWTVVGSRKNKK